MNTFAVLFLCIQAFLVQNVISQCYNPGYGLGLASLAPAAPFAPAAFAPAPFASSPFAPAAADVYGGAGEGNVAVAGELPVAGTTAVAGQVPILGAVSFCGNVPAAGTVTITGNCACDCGASFIF